MGSCRQAQGSVFRFRNLRGVPIFPSRMCSLIAAPEGEVRWRAYSHAAVVSPPSSVSTSPVM
jgi:hypothetical protein